jgi:hypothetical protein
VIILELERPFDKMFTLLSELKCNPRWCLCPGLMMKRSGSKRSRVELMITSANLWAYRN